GRGLSRESAWPSGAGTRRRELKREARARERRRAAGDEGRSRGLCRSDSQDRPKARKQYLQEVEAVKAGFACRRGALVLLRDLRVVPRIAVEDDPVLRVHLGLHERRRGRHTVLDPPARPVPRAVDRLSVLEGSDDVRGHLDVAVAADDDEGLPRALVLLLVRLLLRPLLRVRVEVQG